jgi:hypothetical protein
MQKRVKESDEKPEPQENPDYWRALSLAGKSDQDVMDLNEAIFLFAVGKIRESSNHARLWERYARHWKRRLPGAAVTVLMAFWEETVKGRQGKVETDVSPLPVQTEMKREARE